MLRKNIWLAILVAMSFVLSGCIAWRTGPYDYEFRVPLGDGTYKCCRTEKIKVAGTPPAILKKTESGLPMAKSKFSTGEELAKALGDKKKVNATAGEFVGAINKYHNVGLDEKSLPAYLESLEVVDCPKKEKYLLSSVVTKGKRHLGEIEREFKAGEQCFKDRNTQTIVGSADCGNIGKPAPVAKEAIAGYREVEVCSKCEGPSRYSFGGTVSWGYPGGYYGGGYSSSSSAPVVGGGAATVTAPTPTRGSAPAFSSKVDGVPAPAAVRR